MFLNNLSNPNDLFPPNDPIFDLPVSQLFWIIGTIQLAIAMFCFFSRHTARQSALVVLYPAVFLASRFYLAEAGICAGFKGYLGGLGDVFNMSGVTIEDSFISISFYLIIGGGLSFLW